jgi:hypothetical protein
MVDKGNVKFTSEGLNRVIEKNIGHIFVVSRKLLAEFLDLVEDFFQEPLLSQADILKSKGSAKPEVISNVVDIKKLQMEK